MMADTVEARLIFMTAPDYNEAVRIVNALVSERIVACGTIVPAVTSVYRWKGSVTTENEVFVLLKTVSEREGQTLQRIRELHPYDVPEAIAVDVTAGLPSYMSWIHESTQEVDEG